MSSAGNGEGGVLYVTYDGLLEPLGASQVLPYVLGVRAAGVPISILSFEKPGDLAAGERVQALERHLGERDVRWHRRRYHRRPTLPATALDVVAGRGAVAAWHASGTGARVVHARGYISALMARVGASRGARILFDMRGFWVDERIEGGYWAPGGLQERVGRWVERAALEAADHLVVLTRKGAGRVGDLLPSAAAIPATVIPTCVDLDRFRPPESRSEARRSLQLGEGPVLIHVGTLTGWYDGPGTLAVARAFLRRTGGRFVILTRDVERARALAGEADVEARVATADPADVPRWLQAADAGLALVRPSPAKDASYPTKVGEYLAAGLAVLATPVGDMSTLADGTVVGLLDGRRYEDAAAWLVEATGRAAREEEARALARSELSLEGGVRRLLAVYRSLGVASGGAT